METVYKREKKYNDEAGGRLSGDMDDTKENGDKVKREFFSCFVLMLLDIF